MKLDWFDLLHLEHPERAVDVITQFKGPYFQGQSISQLIHGIDQLCPGGYINQGVVESALRSGDFFLVPFGEAMSPLLRYIVTINTNNALGNQQTSEWQLSTNTNSDHLTSTLESLMRDVKEPVRVAAAARQKAKPNSSGKNQDKQAQQKETYWIELVCNYKNSDQSVSSDLPYKVTFSDGSTKKGTLGDKPVYLKDIPKGEVQVEFGYPEEIKEIDQARRNLKAGLTEIIAAAKERGDMLDDMLKKEGIVLQGLIVTGAFFDGMSQPIKDIPDFFVDLAEEARVWMDQWDEKEIQSRKDELYEKVSNKKDAALAYVGEIDEIREKAWNAFKVNDMEEFNKQLEELARYADDAEANVQAYGRSAVKDLEESYNVIKILCSDKQVHKMLKQFAEDYTDCLSITQSARNTGELVGTIGMVVVLSIVGGYVGAAAAVSIAAASKASAVSNIYDKITDLTDLLKLKKLTPEKQPVGNHNNKLSAKNEKTEEQPVKEKDKQKCNYSAPGASFKCQSAYNKNCGLCHKEAKKYGSRKGSKPNKGSSSTLSSRIMLNLQKKGLAKINNQVLDANGKVLYPTDLSQKKDHKSYHPWFQGDETLAAHHIICSAAVKEDRWIDYFNMCAYSINCKENGTMLPSQPDIACQLGVALHYKNHKEGKATTYGSNISYTKGVKNLLLELEEKISENGYCNNPEKLKISIDRKSKLILKYISKFSWTLTGDGQDYRPNTASKKYMGCAGNLKVNKLTPKINHCTARRHDFIFPSNFNTPLEVGK